MILFQKRVKQEGALGEGNEQQEQANISSNDSEKLRGAELLTLDVEMVVGSTVLTVNLLSPDYLSCDTVGMVPLVLAVAWLNPPGVDSQELQVLALVVEVLSEAPQER